MKSRRSPSVGTENGLLQSQTAGPVLTVGFETNYSSGRGKASKTLLMPQIHWEATDNVMIQGGLGAEIRSGITDGQAALRVIYTF